MTDQADFLLARIAEDEAVARAAFQQVKERVVGGWYWSDAGDAVFLDDTPTPVACGPWKQPMHQPSAQHMVRWDPERVLAECLAKRRIVESAQRAFRGREEFGRSPLERGAASGFGLAVTLLAMAYADHPEYREEYGLSSASSNIGAEQLRDH
ncbi:DUF6221 family protein [Modestobacter sp. VKM Ac-2977]|uniref:DUF6221 family protein n=1 Tax=Modestobacter sp. VKM Ac-2977 TaxID=3004131 RepID=UPI0022AAD896|nr:DUF6221 family protein [Modestobacter sp. VKM Ac-2977]MCZ2821311.1 DUF6221 family protein [Modestobacter sp. VKM Ac-2977]